MADGRLPRGRRYRPPAAQRRNPGYRRVASLGYDPLADPPAQERVSRRQPGGVWARLKALKVLAAFGAGFLAVVLAVSLVGALIAVGHLDRVLHRFPALTAYPGQPAPGRGTTWLLVGSDSRRDLTDEQRHALAAGDDHGEHHTDTLLLIHTPALPSAGPTVVVSVPRDSYVSIPGYGWGKINTAYQFGGAALLARTVEEATGLRLDRYAEVGFLGFAGLVDALGGVRICLDESITDPLAGLDLPAGCQMVDGRRALGYARTRATPRADLDRMVHQRLLLEALHERATGPAVWLNPWRWYAVPRAAADAVNVDDGVHVWHLGILGWALRRPVVELTVPVSGFATTDVGDVVLWDERGAAELFEALRRDARLVVTASGQAQAVARSCALVRPGWLVAIQATPASRQKSTSSGRSTVQQ